MDDDEFEDDDEAEDDGDEDDEADQGTDDDDGPEDITMAYESITKGVRQRRRTMQQQRCDLAKEKAAEKARDKATRGDSPVENVKALLRHHHQSVVGGWRKAIDRTTTHRIGKLAFCKALRELGCKEDYNEVWMDLGGKRGHLTLADFDDEAAQILSAFYRGYVEKINIRIHSLVEDIDSLRIDCTTFVEKCKLLMHDMELEDVFKALRLDIPFITAVDLEWLEQYCERGHKPEPTKSAEDKVREELRQESLANAARKKAVKDFKMLCHHRCGGVINAWREIIDPAGRGRLPREDLRKGATKLGFTGDFDVLWTALAGEGYVVELNDLEPAAVEALESFKKSCIARFGSMKFAFQSLTAKDMPLVARDEFIRWCKEIRSDHGSDKLLWRYLDEGNCGKILLEVIDPDTTEEACGKENMQTASELYAELEQLPKKAPPITLIEREEKKQQENPSPPSEDGKNMHKTLLEMFNKKFGSTVRAWKMGLDVKGVGKLTKDEFFLGCSVLGYRGNLNDVWTFLKMKETSHIRLRDLDPTTGEDVRQFREKCIDRFGTVHDALQKVSKAKKSTQNARVNEDQFNHLCKLLSIGCPYKKLWTHLDPTKRGVVSTKSIGWLTNIPDTDEKALARNLCQMVEGQRAKREQRQIEMAASTSYTAKEQKKKSEEFQKTKDAQKRVAKKRDKLLKMLSVDYKAIGRGWIIAMDPDRLGELTLDDFYTGLERLGMLSHEADDDELVEAEDLFKLFDPEDTQVISLDRFDHGLTTEAVNDLKHHLVERYGSLLLAFQPPIEANLLNKASDLDEEKEEEEEENEDESNVLTHIPLKDFRHMCQEAKFTSAIHRLIMFLDPYGSKKIDLSNIDEDVASEALELAQEEIKMRQRLLKRRQRSNPHMLRQDVRVGVACGTEARDKMRETRQGTEALKDFKNRCVSKYGSLATAWQELINLDGEEDTIGFDVFSQACSQLECEAIADAAWAALDLKEGVLSLRDLDANIDKDVAEFNFRILERFGTIDNAINETDIDDSFEMNYKSFTKLLFECQYRRNMRRLYEYFGGVYKDKKSAITFLNIDAEAVERVKAKRKEDQERKQLGKPLDPKHQILKKRMSKTSQSTAGEDDEDEDAQSDSQGGKPRQTGSVVLQRVGQDPAALFRIFLCRRFGVVRRAWRVIDVHQQAALTKSEFSSACRVIGFGGSASNVWNACGCKELLSLKDLDPVSWQLLARYRKLFIKRSGNLENAFIEESSLDYDAFCEICKKIECPKPWDTLFDILDVRCRGVISWDDVKFLDEDFDWSRGVPLRKCAIPLGGSRDKQLPARVTGMGHLCTSMKPRRVCYSMTNSLPNISPGLRANWNDRHNIIDCLGNKTENLMHAMKYVNVQDEIRIARRVAKKIRDLPTSKMIEDNVTLSASFQDDDDGWNDTDMTRRKRY